LNSKEALTRRLFVIYLIKYVDILLSDAAADRFIANPVNIGFNPFIVKCFSDFRECRIGASLLMGTPVDQQYFHDFTLPFQT
jgi:hypothetical protein